MAWLLLLAALFGAAVLYPTLFRGYEALRLLADIGDANWFASYRSQRVERRLIHFHDEQYVADLYPSIQGDRAAIVLQHGAAESGKDDLRLVRFAEQLARAGFTVIVPEMPGAKSLRVSSADIPVLVHAVDYLQQSGVAANGGGIGIGGFSVSSGLAMHAAMLPQLQENVSFILSVGGYYDLNQTLHYMTTSSFMLDGQRHHMTASEYGKWVFVLSNLDKIADSTQRELLHQVAVNKYKTGNLPVALVSQLSGEARAVYLYAENSDWRRAEGLMQQLPVALREEIARLNLANKDLTRLHASVLLVHGRDDDIIPYSQSIALQRALPPSQVRLYLLNHWAHMDPRGDALDGWTLYRALYRLLALRDGLPG